MQAGSSRNPKSNLWMFDTACGLDRVAPAALAVFAYIYQDLGNDLLQIGIRRHRLKERGSGIANRCYARAVDF
jgi:hypothetical protein